MANAFVINLKFSVVFVLIHLISRSNGIDVVATVDTDNVIHTTDERYLSVVMGMTTIRHNWATLNFSLPRLYTLAEGLSPAILRVGGNEADLLVFNRSATEEDNIHSDFYCDFLDFTSFESRNQCGDPISDFTMTAKQWDQLNTFAASVGWNVLFDLNALLRKGEDWDASNAIELLEYSIEKNYYPNLNFELGNEPNDFPHLLNRSLDPTQLGKDFLQLHYILKQGLMFKKYFENCLLVGPDTTKPIHDDSKVLDYMKAILKVAGHSLSAITWHQYYIDGRTATVTDFIDPKNLALFPQEAERIKKAIKELGLEHKPLMLGETSACWGGSAARISNRFVGGFFWIDKLGIAAQMGHSIVMRQTFYEGDYGLIDRDLNPNPDYWLSLVYKFLVGTNVLNATSNDPTLKTRVYAHCTNTKKTSYQPGAVTVYALNLHTISIDLGFAGSDLESQTKHLYWFTPHGYEGLQAKQVNVNGKKMELVSETQLPTIEPVVTSDVTLKLPPISFGFIVFPNAKVSVCL